MKQLRSLHQHLDEEMYIMVFKTANKRKVDKICLIEEMKNVE